MSMNYQFHTTKSVHHILADIQTQVQIASRMQHHADKSLKLLQISKEKLTDVHYRAN